MNDFTKEELEQIKRFILICKIYDKKFIDEFDALDNLLNKTKAMIDNYCEHEPDYSDKYISIHSFKCKKCGRSYK